MASNGTKRIWIKQNSAWLEFYWEQTSQSIANNTTTISWTFDLYSSGDINSTAPKKCTIIINGKTVFNQSVFIGVNGPGYAGLAAGTTTIAHNNDGTKTFSFSISQKMDIVYSGVSIGTLTGSGTGTLNTIPRSATITSAPNFTDEENPVLKYSNPAGTNATLEAAIFMPDALTSLAGYRTISNTGTSYTFNLTDAERTKMRQLSANTNSLNVRFYLKTTLGGQTYSTYTTKTLTIVNANPTISATATDNSSEQIIALTGGNKLIKYYSSVNVSMQATALKSATITSYKITCGSQNITSASGTFTEVESGSFVFTVVDSRGNIATQTITKDIIDYIKLTCNLDAKNPNAEGEMNFSVSGNYFNSSFGAADNALTIQYRYKANEEEFGDWIDASLPTLSGNTYSCNTTVTGLNYMNAYTFQARAIDKLNTIESSTSTVKAIPIFDWSSNDFNFNVPVHFAQGATGIDIPTPTPTVEVESGTWTPDLADANVTSYGWYTKIGNVVTVGFNLRGSWNSGITAKNIEITGLPFTNGPGLAAGGGIVHGAYLKSQYVFCGWAIASGSNSVMARVYSFKTSTSYQIGLDTTLLSHAGTSFALSGTITYSID